MRIRLVPHLDGIETKLACLLVEPLHGFHLRGKHLALALLRKDRSRRQRAERRAPGIIIALYEADQPALALPVSFQLLLLEAKKTGRQPRSWRPFPYPHL